MLLYSLLKRLQPLCPSLLSSPAFSQVYGDHISKSSLSDLHRAASKLVYFLTSSSSHEKAKQRKLPQLALIRPLHLQARYSKSCNQLESATPSLSSLAQLPSVGRSNMFGLLATSCSRVTIQKETLETVRDAVCEHYINVTILPIHTSNFSLS